MPVISDTLDRTPVIEAHAAPIVDTISPEAICQRVLGARKAAEARAIEWMPDRLRAMEQNSVRASDGKLLLAPKVIAAVIGIIGIPLLAFSFGQIKPFAWNSAVGRHTSCMGRRPILLEEDQEEELQLL